MIPEHESEPRPPLTFEFAFMTALLAPLCHLLWVIVFQSMGTKLGASAIGMGAIVTYGALFALCAVRFRLPPARQLAVVSAPVTAWLAVLFLVPAIVVSSELDNVVKSLYPPQPLPLLGKVTPEPPFLGAALAMLFVGVYPLVHNVFFRGMLQPLATARLGVVLGVIVTSLFSAFAAAFIPSLDSGFWPMAPAVANALMLCILRQCSGSLLPPLALEALWGVVQVCATYQIFGLAGFDGSGSHTPANWVVACGVLTVVGLLLCRAAARSSSPAQG